MRFVHSSPKIILTF